MQEFNSFPLDKYTPNDNNANIKPRLKIHSKSKLFNVNRKNDLKIHFSNSLRTQNVHLFTFQRHIILLGCLNNKCNLPDECISNTAYKDIFQVSSFLILFENSSRLMVFLIPNGTMPHTFPEKYIKDFKPYPTLYIEDNEKSLCEHVWHVNIFDTGGTQGRYSTPKFLECITHRVSRTRQNFCT